MGTKRRARWSPCKCYDFFLSYSRISLARWPEENFEKMIRIMQEGVAQCTYCSILPRVAREALTTGKHGKASKKLVVKSPAKVSWLMKSLLLVPHHLCLFQSSRRSRRLGGGGTLVGDPRQEVGDKSRLSAHWGLQTDAVLINYFDNFASYVRLCLVAYLVHYLDLKFKVEKGKKTKKGKEVESDKAPVIFAHVMTRC